jgi:hypothetical protein
MKTGTQAILRLAFFCVTGTAILSPGALSLTRSTTPQQANHENERDRAIDDCDIDGSVKEMEHCPSEEIIRQYRERYGLTAVMRGGTHWEAVSAQYTNPTYGYRVALPQAIVALSSLPPAPQHGFLIDVGEEMLQPSNANAGRSWLELEVGLWVDGSYNATFYDSVEEAANASLTYLKAEHPDDLIILRWKHTTLRGLPAIHSRIQFRSSKSGETLITDETVALREYDVTGIIYTVTLTSYAAGYRADLAVLKRILEGWRTTDFE